jgi:hypothetical protein
MMQLSDHSCFFVKAKKNFGKDGKSGAILSLYTVKPVFMLKNAIVMIVCVAFFGCENIPLPAPENNSTAEDGFYNYTGHVDSLAANNMVPGSFKLLDSAWMKMAEEAGWSNSNLSVKEVALKKNVVQLLCAAKENWIKLYDKTVAESRTKTGRAMKQQIETEKEFANNFINGILDIAKNTKPLISEHDINNINATGEAFVGLMADIARSETNDSKTGVSKNREHWMQQLLQHRDRLTELIIKAKRRFEAQNNTPLSSSVLFTSIE